MDIKVCGLRQPENLRQVVDLGVNYVGLIFYDRSPRFAAGEELRAWLTANADALANVRKVGVFVNAEVDYVLNTVHDYQLDLVQLHGEESPGYCRELQLLWSVSTLRSAGIVKAFRVTPEFDFDATAAYADSCELFVFDTGGKSAHGGTGEQWNWDRLSEYRGTTPFLLSGGIGPEDGTAIRRLDHPQLAGLDLNSRFETAPGMKDEAVLERFLAQLR